MKGFKKQKDDSNMNIQEEFWDVFLLVAKDRAETSPATPAYAPTGMDLFGVFNEWKKWHMADLDIFALGKTFQEIVWKKGGPALTDEFKEDFWGIQEKLLRPKQDLQQAGFQLSGRTWMWNRTSSQRNHTNHKFITQDKSHKSHPSDSSSHCHPPLISIDGMIQRTSAAV